MIATKRIFQWFIWLVLYGVSSVLADPGLPAHDPETLNTMIDEALFLYRRTRAEQVRFATDPNERGENLVSGRFLDSGVPAIHYFNIGDEAFESEYRRNEGYGRGDGHGAHPLPPQNSPIHDGELGGLDGSSCRVCHFSGGPDGGGRYSQLTFFRGDGQRADSASQRDAPHLMGLGYIQALAQEFEMALQGQMADGIARAERGGRPVTVALRAGDIQFGEAIIYPDGGIDYSGIEGIAHDLRVRPFGWKGRHLNLAELSDEALQLHLGLQSTYRVASYQNDALSYLGPGSYYDPDEDGVQQEITAGQGVLLATYLSLLPVPVIQPPTDPTMLSVWARGRTLFSEIGCATCHRPELRLENGVITQALGDEAIMRFDIFEQGLEPKPVRTDFGGGQNGIVTAGTPIYAFTDLKTHNMGPRLADHQEETLPYDEGVVPAQEWLTRPLWGLADTAPYLHDGRAPTVHDAIIAHGGEAAASTLAYDALPTDSKGALRVFLMSLTREPVLLVE